MPEFSAIHPQLDPIPLDTKLLLFSELTRPSVPWDPSSSLQSHTQVCLSAKCPSCGHPQFVFPARGSPFCSLFVSQTSLGFYLWEPDCLLKVPGERRKQVRLPEVFAQTRDSLPFGQGTPIQEQRGWIRKKFPRLGILRQGMAESFSKWRSSALC